MQQSSLPPPPPPQQQQQQASSPLLGGGGGGMQQQQPMRRFAGNKNNFSFMQSQAQAAAAAAAAGLMLGPSNPAAQLMNLGTPPPNGYRKRPMNTGFSPGYSQHNGKSLFSIPENVVVLDSLATIQTQQHAPTHRNHHHHQQQQHHNNHHHHHQQQQQHHHHQQQQQQQLVATAQTHNLVTFKEPPLLGPGAGFPPFGAPEYHPTQPDNWKGASIHPTGLMKEPTGVVAGRNAPVAFAQQGQAQGAVMMVYGMDHDTSNTDKLFNLVCLYGNVARIKFLKTKEGTAMVQMGDSVAVERCVQHLNNIPVGSGGKIQIAFSKQNFLSEVINPFLLPDHTPSFKEYTGSKNNRFLSPAQASKNRIQPPSKILHFFNTPPGLTEDQLIGIFNIKDVPATSVRLFPLKTERSSSGLIEFPNISQAVLAIMKCNHLPIEGKGTKFPFIMKLCFSSSKSMNGAWNNAANEGMIEKENDGDVKVEIYN
ncbi:sm [Drosophila busckii]|uniref:Sm n=1 Tax=Drosophila busckii TaxID=30019 RepID=A0A0M4EXJ9_DROBS|nr:sm [Drosophila busckii]